MSVVRDMVTLSPRWALVARSIRKATPNTSLPWDRRLARRPPVVLLQADKLSGSTLTLQLSCIVCPRLRTPTVLRLATPCPITPTVLPRPTFWTRTAITTPLLVLTKLARTWLRTLGVRTRRKDIVLHCPLTWKAWALLKRKEDGETKLPIERLSVGS